MMLVRVRKNKEKMTNKKIITNIIKLKNTTKGGAYHRSDYKTYKFLKTILLKPIFNPFELCQVNFHPT